MCLPTPHRPPYTGRWVLLCSALTPPLLSPFSTFSCTNSLLTLCFYHSMVSSLFLFLFPFPSTPLPLPCPTPPPAGQGKGPEQ